jgi:hypothetical protein
MVVFLPAAGESRRDYRKTARTVFLSREYSNVDPAGILISGKEKEKIWKKLRIQMN